jgi:hypothetical protein
MLQRHTFRENASRFLIEFSGISVDLLDRLELNQPMGRTTWSRGCQPVAA